MRSRFYKIMSMGHMYTVLLQNGIYKYICLSNDIGHVPLIRGMDHSWQTLSLMNVRRKLALPCCSYSCFHLERDWCITVAGAYIRQHIGHRKRCHKFMSERQYGIQTRKLPRCYSCYRGWWKQNVCVSCPLSRTTVQNHTVNPDCFFRLMHKLASPLLPG